MKTYRINFIVKWGSLILPIFSYISFIWIYFLAYKEKVDVQSTIFISFSIFLFLNFLGFTFMLFKHFNKGYLEYIFVEKSFICKNRKIILWDVKKDEIKDIKWKAYSREVILIFFDGKEVILTDQIEEYEEFLEHLNRWSGNRIKDINQRLQNFRN